MRKCARQQKPLWARSGRKHTLSRPPFQCWRVGPPTCRRCARCCLRRFPCGFVRAGRGRPCRRPHLRAALAGVASATVHGEFQQPPPEQLTQRRSAKGMQKRMVEVWRNRNPPQAWLRLIAHSAKGAGRLCELTQSMTLDMNLFLHANLQTLSQSVWASMSWRPEAYSTSAALSR